MDFSLVAGTEEQLASDLDTGMEKGHILGRCQVVPFSLI